MAIYHQTVSIISRSNGRNVMQMAAYISGDKLHDERDGETFDHTSKEEVIYSNMEFADRVPEHLRSIQNFWQEVQNNEKADNAQLARAWEIALPVELTKEQAIKAADEFARSLMEKDHMPAIQWSVHWKNGNPHFHGMAPMRDMDESGHWMNKQTKAYSLTEHGDKIPELDPAKLELWENSHGEKFDLQKIDDQLYKDYPDKETRDQKRQEILDEVQKIRERKDRGTKERKWIRELTSRNPWDDRSKLTEWRERWAVIANKHLEMAGHDERIDHRSFKDRGIDQIPTIHEGYKARQMGDQSERVKENENIRLRNLEILTQIKEIEELEHNVFEQQTTLEKLIKAFEDFMQEVSEHGLTRAITDRINRLGSHSHRRSDERDLGYIRELGSGEQGFGAEAVRKFLDKQRADEEKQRAARADREAEQQRLRAEAERAEAARIREEQERVARDLAEREKKRSQSHSQGLSL